MDDWDAINPDLHAALNASMTPPFTTDPMQHPTAEAQPARSEERVQSAQQVPLQSGAGAGATTSRMQFHSALYGQPVQTGTTQSTFTSVQAAPSIGQQQADAPAQQVQPPSSVHLGGTVDSTGGSELSFALHGAGGSSNGPNGGGTPPPFPSFNAGSQNQQRQGQAFTVQVKPKDPPVFRGWAEDDVTTWTAKVQDFYYLTDASDVQQVAYAATLLQDAASDWWYSLLKTRGGIRPRNFVKFADLLG